MEKRKLRILIAKPGLDGHDRGARTVALGLRDAGMEVIYSGLHCTPEIIINTAIEESVDAIGLSVLSGAHMTIFPKILDLMSKNGLENVCLFGGGVISPNDVNQLLSIGIGAIFPPGSSIQSIADYLNSNITIENSAG